MRILLLGWGLFLLSTATASAATTTTAGTVSLAPRDSAIVVTAPYSGDDTGGNNTLLVEWSTDNFVSDINSEALDHATSPYLYTIEGLVNGTIYQVRVTYNDEDGVLGTSVQTLSQRVYNPVLHSSYATGSDYWSGSWGVSGGQYGSFTCGTCHARNTGNIKRVRGDWSEASLPSVPAKADAAVVSFLDNRDGTAMYALDDSTNHATSSRICEACHTLTSHHRYDETSGSGVDHHSTKDCTDCHKHSLGFKPSSCSGCHGGGSSGTIEDSFWPDSIDRTVDTAGSADDAGAHAVHMAELSQKVYALDLQGLLDDSDSANKQTTLCGYCHATPGADSDHTLNDNAEVTQVRILWDGSVDGDAALNYDYIDTATATCSNVACHNRKTTASWYSVGSGCTLCHSDDKSNAQALADPGSGLHFADPGFPTVEGHDAAFGGSGQYGCLDCHADPPTDAHLNGIGNTPATATFSFDGSGKTIKLGTLDDASDDTCAAACHSDNNVWYRFWDPAAYDDTAIDPTQALPGRCGVCHGLFGAWAEGTSHAATWQGSASIAGSSHNSQNPNVKPGADCEDCHVHPSRNDLHENAKITLNDDAGSAVDPVEDAPNERVFCQPCHTSANAGLPGEQDSEAFAISLAFPVERVEGANLPIGSCFSGAAGCHGDKENRWWPAADPEADGQLFEGTDPTPRTIGVTNYGYPNRSGAHIEHNITIGELICETRTGSPCTADPNDAIQDPTDQDYNNTCSFCHPMSADEYGVLSAISHRDGVTDLYGGWRYPGADAAGTNVAGDPIAGAWSQYEPNLDGNGYIYQLDDPANPGTTYPLDEDGTYRQFLYDYKSNSALNHGTCSNVACHSNAPFTPNWYGDEQAPAAISDLAGTTHDNRDGNHVDGETDMPGTVLLTWTAPGDNGDLDGTAYEYEVYYSTSGPITEANVASATRAGGAPTVLRRGEAQEMVVDGLDPGTAYHFAVRTKDQPFYEDTDGDGIHETFFHDGNLSPLATYGPVSAHVDDVKPVFWGINQAYSHDSGDKINVSWDSARDHTLPIIYRIYYSTYSLKTHLAMGGTLPEPTATAYGGDFDTFRYKEYVPGDPVIPPEEVTSEEDYTIMVRVTKGIDCQIEGLEKNVLYNIMVRAEDGTGTPPTTYGNVDENNVVTMAMSTAMPAQDTVTMLYLADGTTGLTNQLDLAAPDWSVTDGSTTGTVTWTSPTQLDDDLFGSTVSRAVWLDGISFDLTVTNGDKRLAHSFNLEFGFNNGAEVPLSTSTVSVGRRASRLMKIGLSDVSSEIPADAKLYVKLMPADTSLTFTWGADTTKGQLLVNSQAINHPPSAPTGVTLVENPGGYVDVTWTPSNDGTPSDGGQPVHYDVVASCDGGAHWCYIIGLNQDNTAATNGVTWDTVGNGLTKGTFDCAVRVEASDGYLYETDGSVPSPGGGVWESHVNSPEVPITIDNILDDEAPAAVKISHVEPRPKQGSAYVHWLAVGNDGLNHGTRAAYYDIRYRKVADGDLVANWDDLDDSDGTVTVKVEGAPVPDFSGNAEEYELVDMTPDTDYQIGIVTCDESDNCSGISNVYPITSGQYYCGICHSTPPDEPDTGGTHRQHGYTLEDCAKCHGDGTSSDGNNVMAYDGRHYDGVINIGWAKDGNGNRAPLVELAPHSGGSGVTITQNNGSDVTIYEDLDGAGGFNAAVAYDSDYPLNNTDSGRCSNFGPANANGCHGPFEPKWASDNDAIKTVPTCADCHGDKKMVVNDDAGTQEGRLTDPYGRQWDQIDHDQAPIEYPASSGNFYYPPEQELLASPPIDNHNIGGKDTRYTGAHLRHLNASFRFAKQDSCRLCHENTMMLGLHANGEVDVLFDGIAGNDETGADIDQEHETVDTVGATCSNLNNLYCHDSGANWAEPGAKCNSCHGMGAKTYDTAGDVTTIGHVMGAMGDVVECTYCHVPGHPQSPDGITPGDPETLLINNNSAVGINYRSGGIHLRKVYPWGTYDSLAEICWGCHDQNHDGDNNDPGDISEWGVNEGTGSNYNFGQLEGTSSWVGTWNGTSGSTAIWSSGYGLTPTDPFYYKRGYIQSTHTTDPSGTSKLTWNAAAGRYDETPDTVDKIRCSNCHDVHDSNLAEGDTVSGPPYLRGTWKSNPYEEDGAPFNKTYAESDSLIKAVPRGTTAYRELGGYYIDQNNVEPGTGNTTHVAASYPTSGWTLESSAGLCIRCHTDDVDNMDQRDDAELDGYVLWLGGNGHSNSAIGGSFVNAENIFDYTHGRPVAQTVFSDNSKPSSWPWAANMVADMGMTSQTEYSMGMGTRSNDTGANIIPVVAQLAYNKCDWGASVDAGTEPDQMYHQFSCSKCHNPHASRLPKLMITNCLDIRHNTWDDNKSGIQNAYTNTALQAVDRNMRAAYFASAANCHRFDPARGDTNNDNVYDNRTLRGGWNRVTPWVRKNDGTNAEHKGTTDPAYGTSNSTSPWTHSDFPTEPSGW